MRDLWEKKNLGEFLGDYKCAVDGHSARLFKVGKAKAG